MRRAVLYFVLLITIICGIVYEYSLKNWSIRSMLIIAGSTSSELITSYIGTNGTKLHTQYKATNGSTVPFPLLKRNASTSTWKVNHTQWLANEFDATQSFLNETVITNSEKVGVNRSMTRGDVESCQKLEEEITIVTAFFYLGERFPKGGGSRKSRVYFEWIKIYKQIHNPVVAYFGRKEDVTLFQKLRQLSDDTLKTKAVLLNTTNLWAFQLQEQLRNALHSSDKSRKLLREYNCIQHAKYEVLLQTSEENPFCTRYIQWLDIGLFRELVTRNISEPFSLWLPADYNQSRVAYTGIRKRSISRDPGDIIRNGGCWLVGATALANITLMKIWAKGYMAYTESTIQKYKVIVSDQTILYSWMNTNNTVLPVQEYRGEEGGSWFSLGYRCRRAGLSRNLTQLKQFKQTVHSKVLQ